MKIPEKKYTLLSRLKELQRMPTIENELEDELLLFVQDNNRVCPVPPEWNKLFQLLPGSTDTDKVDKPYPLILNAWWYSSDNDKRNRLKDQIHWAKEHNGLIEITDYLLTLTESDWMHVKE